MLTFKPEVLFDLELTSSKLKALFLFGENLQDVIDDPIWGKTHCCKQYLNNCYEQQVSQDFFSAEFDDNNSLSDMISFCTTPSVVVVRTYSMWKNSKSKTSGINLRVMDTAEAPDFVEFQICNGLRNNDVMLISKDRSFFQLSSRLNDMAQRRDEHYYCDLWSEKSAAEVFSDSLKRFYPYSWVILFIDLSTVNKFFSVSHLNLEFQECPYNSLFEDPNSLPFLENKMNQFLGKFYLRIDKLCTGKQFRERHVLNTKNYPALKHTINYIYPGIFMGTVFSVLHYSSAFSGLFYNELD